MECDNCYLIADVDEDSYEYVHDNHTNRQKSRPFVGVTPHTRFRRAPTLDMIRSTKMPLSHEESISPSSSKPFYLSNRHERSNFDLYRDSYFSSSGLNNTFHVAQF